LTCLARKPKMNAIQIIDISMINWPLEA